MVQDKNIKPKDFTGMGQSSINPKVMGCPTLVTEKDCCMLTLCPGVASEQDTILHPLFHTIYSTLRSHTTQYILINHGHPSTLWYNTQISFP